LGTLVEQEKNAASLKDQKAATLADLEARDAAGDDATRATLKPQLERARSEYEAAQKFYAGFGEQKTKAQKAIDENAPSQAPSDPRVKQYADKFFGGDIKKAQAAIAKQRGQ
jgi:restriction endonuclease